MPGVGKTTLAKALARALDVTFTRVQFTPDLLPTDILGSQVLNPRDGTFAFHKGPVFTNVLLADEINRASPRTQSALLEAMNEAQVTVDGVTHTLPSPFFVVATQNPSDYQGTYPLPEAQLDRFLLRIGVGYPSADAELAMLFARQSADPLAKVTAVCDRDTIVRIQREVREVEMKDAVAAVPARDRPAHAADRAPLELGISPRGALAFFRAAQARALLQGRTLREPRRRPRARRAGARASRAAHDAGSLRRRDRRGRARRRRARRAGPDVSPARDEVMKIDFARLNHILIPKGKEERDRFRESRLGRVAHPARVALLGLAHRRRALARSSSRSSSAP